MKTKLLCKVMTLLLFFNVLMTPSALAQNWNQLSNDILGDQASSNLGTVTTMSGDGNVLAVGSEIYDGVSGIDSGIVRVYENVQGNWTQIGNNLEGVNAGDEFGGAIALNFDGSLIAIGAVMVSTLGTNYGQVKLFENQNGSWIEVAQFNGLSNNDRLGNDLSFSATGNRLAISAEVEGFGGTVRIYEENNGVWGQLGQTLVAQGGGDRFGTAIDLNNDGSVVIVGGVRNDSNGSNSGHVQVYFFDSNDSLWKQVGQDIVGDNSNDQMGSAVAINGNGDRIIIGIRLFDNIFFNSGAAKVYELDVDSEWIQVGSTFLGTSANGFLGYSVDISVDGSTIAYGVPVSSGNTLVRVYEESAGSWVQKGGTILGLPGDATGRAIKLSDDGLIIAVGDPLHDANSIAFSGRARVFEFDNSLSISNYESNVSPKIYPNPVDDYLTISIQNIAELKTIDITDLRGRLLKSYSDFPSDNLITLPVNQLESGTFLLKFNYKNRRLIKKLIKE